MNTKFLTLIVLGLAAMSAHAERGLTPVTRESCVSFPKVIAADKMKVNIHYTKHTYCVYEGNDDICAQWDEYLKFNYYYFLKSTVDYYSADGKLVTTKKDSLKLDLSATADSPEVGEEALKTEIEKNIYSNREPVCADSFYK